MRMASRRKKISFFYATLCVAMGLFLLSGRIPFLEIHELHDISAHHVELHDHDEKSTHVHTHRHKDGSTHSHTHYHGHCGSKISGDPMNYFHLSASISPHTVWLFHSVIATFFDPVIENHIPGIFRPPILA